MPGNKGKRKHFFDFRLRYLAAGLLLAGTVWLILQLGVPEAARTIVVYCTPELTRPLANCIEEFTLREGHNVIVLTQPPDILAAHLIRTREGDVILTTNGKLFRELMTKNMIGKIADTVLACPLPHETKRKTCLPTKVKAAILRGARHPGTAQCLLTFLSKPECANLFHYSVDKRSGRRS